MIEASPCKDCTNRHPACHDQCEKHKHWRDQYHAQQRHLKDNRYILNIPTSAARERAQKRSIKNSGEFRRKGGDQ